MLAANEEGSRLRHAAEQTEEKKKKKETNGKQETKETNDCEGVSPVEVQCPFVFTGISKLKTTKTNTTYAHT